MRSIRAIDRPLDGMSALRTFRAERVNIIEDIRLARTMECISHMVPRSVFPGCFYLITRRCTQRQFLLRPDNATNNVFIYCLGEAAQRFDIEVILPSVMSNHYHCVLFDRYGRINEFVQHFHKFVAKCMNALRGRWENLWASEPVCKVKCIKPRDVLAKIVYAATNPVKDFLVDTVAHWPGVNGLYPLLNDKPMRARRPTFFFRDEGPMPAEVTLRFVIPPELGDPDEIRSVLRERVEKIEGHFQARRARTGRRILGRRHVLRQSWRDSPTSIEPRRNLRPRVAAKNTWARIEALQRDRQFVVDYRAARISWLAGLSAVFPAGTYWLHRFAGVPVASFPA
jgi:putative transposase